ncbi:hypothetical protein GYMLUDRAFT_55383 [Collybiopsis luxurians FD-317 M1]|nr:hypothetical protein GYMLUDRAFT_55383 [Collybiopsis luxurians FD-317 M1]
MIKFKYNVAAAFSLNNPFWSYNFIAHFKKKHAHIAATEVYEKYSINDKEQDLLKNIWNQQNKETHTRQTKKSRITISEAHSSRLALINNLELEPEDDPVVQPETEDYEHNEEEEWLKERQHIWQGKKRAVRVINPESEPETKDNDPAPPRTWRRWKKGPAPNFNIQFADIGAVEADNNYSPVSLDSDNNELPNLHEILDTAGKTMTKDAGFIKPQTEPKDPPESQTVDAHETEGRGKCKQTVTAKRINQTSECVCGVAITDVSDPFIIACRSVGSYGSGCETGLVSNLPMNSLCIDIPINFLATKITGSAMLVTQCGQRENNRVSLVLDRAIGILY